MYGRKEIKMSRFSPIVFPFFVFFCRSFSKMNSDVVDVDVDVDVDDDDHPVPVHVSILNEDRKDQEHGHEHSSNLKKKATEYG